MQKARDQARSCDHRPLTACKHVVSGSLSSPLGVLPIFRSRYWFTIGRLGVLSLAGWSPPIPTHFHVLSRTQVSDPRFSPVAYRTFTVSGPPFRVVQLEYFPLVVRPYYPNRTSPAGLGSSPFARRY